MLSLLRCDIIYLSVKTKTQHEQTPQVWVTDLRCGGGGGGVLCISGVQQMVNQDNEGLWQIRCRWRWGKGSYRFISVWFTFLFFVGWGWGGTWNLQLLIMVRLWHTSCFFLLSNLTWTHRSIRSQKFSLLVLSRILISWHDPKEKHIFYICLYEVRNVSECQIFKCLMWKISTYSWST